MGEAGCYFEGSVGDVWEEGAAVQNCAREEWVLMAVREEGKRGSGIYHFLRRK
jgi:hypothetical protein